MYAIFYSASGAGSRTASPVQARMQKEKKRAPEIGSNSNSEAELLIDTGVEESPVRTEEEALIEIPAIPLYFPTSYSLVKPYVRGFEMNTLDAPSLKNVSIDNSWQPSTENG